MARAKKAKVEEVEVVEAVETTEGETKIKIRPNTDKYVASKTANGAKSLHCGDAVAAALAGLLADEVITVTEEITGVEGLADKYAKLNDGQKRMNCGNRLRGWANKQSTLIEKVNNAIAELDDPDDYDGDEAPADPIDTLNEAVSGYADLVAERMKPKAKAKKEEEVEEEEAA